MFRRQPTLPAMPSGPSPVQVQTTELATLYAPRIGLIKDVLVPQTPEQANVLTVIVSACLRANSISISPSQIECRYSGLSVGYQHRNLG